MLSGVKCLVDQCVYNQSLHCTAASILIKSQGNDVVGTTRGTLCDTFSYRNPNHPKTQS
ncbi:DUF1540 domain-containing protein [Sulfoacidibacillus thermotolerans]|uniref:DUF1540 domain-containing protein n=1 Tax=Sulfoacidibacillus thermotolerans TaxID=1765684 RepID=UPI000D6A0274|nr:DUF1540 domain-containing protein [Sulfoacidibacillus thermotolerans]